MGKMVLLPLVQSFFIFLSITLTESIDGNTQKDDRTCTNEQDCASKIQNNDDNKCAIFMAPSSIPQAGFGVYTVKKIKARTPLVNYPAAPSIAVVDDYFHYGEDPVCAHENYYWSSDGYTSFEGDEVHEFVVNFGSLCNYHTYLSNVGHLQGMIIFIYSYFLICFFVLLVMSDSQLHSYFLYTCMVYLHEKLDMMIHLQIDSQIQQVDHSVITMARCSLQKEIWKQVKKSLLITELNG